MTANTTSPPTGPAAIRITSQTNALAVATYLGVVFIGAGALAGLSTAVQYLAWMGRTGIGVWAFALIGAGTVGVLACIGTSARFWRTVKRRPLKGREVAGTKVVALTYEGIAAAVAGACCALLQGAIMHTDGFVVSTPAVVALGGAARLVQVIAEVRRITTRHSSE